MRSYIFIIILMIYAFAKAQESSPVSNKALQSIFIQHDNDFLLGVDRYYTAGTFIGYSRQLPKDFIFKRTEEFPLQLDFTLGQETYTPRELFEIAFDRLERPYAGYLFLKSRLTKANEDELFSLSLDLGLAGEQSIAGDFQVEYHKFINEFIPVWSGEIGNSFHLNTYGSYVKDFVIPNSNLFKNLTLQSTVALGTRQIFARQEALLFIGKREVVGHSSAFNRLGSEEEFYGFVGAGAEYVNLNALIQGHPWGDDSPFTLPIVSAVFSLKAGMVYRGGRNTYKFIYNYRTKETEREGRSQYSTVSYTRRF